jgi:galactonate dehydratase
LNIDVALEHPYDPNSYLNIHKDGWEKRLGQAN